VTNIGVEVLTGKLQT